MLRAHIMRHTVPTSIIVPLTQHGHNAVCPPAPGKTIGAARLLFQGRRLIEGDLNRFADKARRKHALIHSHYLPAHRKPLCWATLRETTTRFLLESELWQPLKNLPPQRWLFQRPLALRGQLPHSLQFLSVQRANSGPCRISRPTCPSSQSTCV